MNSKTQYNTKQHEEILNYLISIQGEHVTAGDVYRFLRDRPEGRKIGQATVYRQLDRLVEEGLVSKYIIDQNSSACYEYIGTEDCGEDLCVHGKCMKCGKLFHLHCDEIRDLEKHLKEHHGFTPDFHHTVIYGLCDECRINVDS